MRSQRFRKVDPHGASSLVSSSCSRGRGADDHVQRAIDNGQVEGFPSPDEVRTFYVEHDVDGDETENSIVSFVLKDTRILKTEAECRAVLESVGFTPDRQEAAIGSLSGGWKMKLALARAILFEVSPFVGAFVSES